ncbi:MAG: peptidoglycan bridge formation glycyltransferase FemA/FemB family protein [Gemmatimonadetes bacterium]|nr:peptidoglycan bridge formation glycyltransferase FemA/FemB family protein [Gemmatimonadota bacterium]
MPGGSEAHHQAEADDLDSGGKPALPHRAAWKGAQDQVSSLAVQLVDRSSGRSEGLFCADRIPSRLFPGFDILRVERFGGFRRAEVARGAVEALARVADGEGRVVRTRVELFSLDPNDLGLVADLLETEGFARSEEPRCYEETALLDLAPPLEEVFSGLHGTARRHVRAVDKNPVEIREILDEDLAPRMSRLLADTFERTGAVPDGRDWASVIRFSGDHPSLSRLLGLFRTDETGPEALLAFVWGACHGSSVEYVSGASTRVRDLKMPLSYGLMWKLIEWGHAQGALRFDFGGISAGSHHSQDPVGGISDFKRYFRPDVQTVGAEFVRAESAALEVASRVVGRLRALGGAGSS